MSSETKAVFYAHHAESNEHYWTTSRERYDNVKPNLDYYSMQMQPLDTAYMLVAMDSKKNMVYLDWVTIVRDINPDTWHRFRPHGSPTLTPVKTGVTLEELLNDEG